MSVADVGFSARRRSAKTSLRSLKVSHTKNTYHPSVRVNMTVLKTGRSTKEVATVRNHEWEYVVTP